MKIYKYRLMTIERQTISIPSDAKFLSVQNQHDNITLWFAVNPDSDLVDDIEFILVGTGENIPPLCGYLGTVQQGIFVWHIYENPLVWNRKIA